MKTLTSRRFSLCAMLASLAFIVTSIVIFAAPGQMRTNIMLVWSPPPNLVYSVTNGTEVVTITNTVDQYVIYSSSDPTVNTTNWPKFLAVSGNTTNVSFSVIPARVQFYVVTASNFWGESLPSNVAATPSAPSRDVNLRIQ